MHCTLPMPVMTTRLSWGSKVSSCDAICSALRDGARRCWGRCRLVGTSDITPAAQAIWRSIRPMVNECLPPSLVAPLELHGMAFFAPRSLAYARLLGRASDPAFRGERPVEPCSEDSSCPSYGQQGLAPTSVSRSHHLLISLQHIVALRSAPRSDRIDDVTHD